MLPRAIQVFVYVPLAVAVSSTVRAESLATFDTAATAAFLRMTPIWPG
jgi:hypothetical protein